MRSKKLFNFHEHILGFTMNMKLWKALKNHVLIFVAFVICLLQSSAFSQSDLIITGVIDGPLSGGTPKAVEFYVVNSIADLSIYGFGAANNGGGTDGEEFTFPPDAVTTGSFIYVAKEVVNFTAWFGFAPTYTNGTAPNINGDDAIELFKNGNVVDVFGDINTDGTGQPWEYMDGWAYRVDGSGPDGSAFSLSNWFFSSPNTLDGETSNAAAAMPFPTGTYTYSLGGDAIPAIVSTTPANGVNNVSVDADIVVNFSEDVAVAGSWFQITGTSSGAHSANFTGGPQIFTLDPDADFDNSETVIVTILAAQVNDLDLQDPPDNMVADFDFSFMTEAGMSGIVINEIYADPANDLSGDANGDGTRDTSDDEFVELVNNSGSSMDISGWTLSDGVRVRHTFPSGTTIPDQCSIVVFGGGTLTGTFGGAIVQEASTGSLALNNGGDTVTLSNGVADIVSYAYGSEGGDDQSLTRDPDISGLEPLVKHSNATSSGGTLFSPGTKIDGSVFPGCPQPASVNINNLISPRAILVFWDTINKKFSFRLAIKNISKTPIITPIEVEFVSIQPAPPAITVDNADAGGNGLGAKYIYTDSNDADNVLSPNEESLLKEWRLNDPGAVNFSFFVNVYGILSGSPSLTKASNDDIPIGMTVDLKGNKIEISDTISEVDNSSTPESFLLQQNYPNPFNPGTNIRYELPEDTPVKIIIYNLMGQEIRTLVDGREGPGIYTITWDGKDNAGRQVASGIYLYQMKVKNFSDVKKLTLLR